MEQIETLRFVEIVKISRNEFPVQFGLDVFFRRYSFLITLSVPLRQEKVITVDTCRRLLQLLERLTNMKEGSTWWNIEGQTVFLKIPLYLKLEDIYQETLDISATRIQAFIRGRRQRKRHMALMNNILMIQRKYRKSLAQKKFNQRKMLFQGKLAEELTVRQQKEDKQKKKVQEKQEKEGMLNTLKQIDFGETFVFPQKLARQNIETKLLAMLTSVDVIKWRHLFIHDKKKVGHPLTP